MIISAKLWKPSNSNKFFRFYLNYEAESFGEMIEKTLGFVEISGDKISLADINPIYHDCITNVLNEQIVIAAKKWGEDELSADLLDCIKSFEFKLVGNQEKSKAVQETIDNAKAESEFLGLPKMTGSEPQIDWATLIRIEFVKKVGLDNSRMEFKFKKDALFARFWVGSKDYSFETLKKLALKK